MRAAHGLGIPQTVEERALATRVAGVLWLTAGVAFPIAMLMPGAHGAPLWATLVIEAMAIGWGIVCFALSPNAPRAALYHLPAIVSLPLYAGTVAATGGAMSPAKLFMVFLVAYAAYFYSPAAAVPYVAGAAVAHALPLVYDDGALAAGFPGEVVVATFAYVVLGAVIGASKRQLVDARERASRLALTDPLTDLPNRRALADILEAHADGRLGLVLLDVDNFKDANTLLGHPGGDRVLCATAEAIRGAARRGDMVARLGGDEFAVVASDPSPEAMALLAGRVLDAVRRVNRRLDLRGYELRASAGWAILPDDAGSIEGLTTAADVALRAAKEAGKGHARPADPASPGVVEAGV